jgi:hypothetical protein
MKEAIDKFFFAYKQAFSTKTVYSDKFPKEMMANSVDGEGWVEWKAIDGTLERPVYERIEDQYKVKFPASFIEWHRAYFFLNCDCSLLRLPISNPLEPAKDIEGKLNWYIPKQIIPKKLFPFGSEGNDSGPLVFDGRAEAVNNEFPVRVYNQEFGGALEGLSEIIFSSFPKLLACITHYMLELNTRNNFDILPDFFGIDPTGAGKTGIDYWLTWASGQRADFEESAF